MKLQHINRRMRAQIAPSRLGLTLRSFWPTTTGVYSASCIAACKETPGSLSTLMSTAVANGWPPSMQPESRLSQIYKGFGKLNVSTVRPTPFGEHSLQTRRCTRRLPCNLHRNLQALLLQILIERSSESLSLSGRVMAECCCKPVIIGPFTAIECVRLLPRQGTARDRATWPKCHVSRHLLPCLSVRAPGPATRMTK